MFAPSADLQVASGSQSPWAEATAVPARDTILVVEDETPIAGLLTCILERGNFRALRAANGAECMALFAAEKERVALVMLDGILPDIHGGALAHQLRAYQPALPLLFVSGRDVSGLRDAFAAQGPTGILRKPFLPPEALRQVRTLIAASA